MLLDGFPDYLLGGHHHAHVDNLIIITSHHHADYILTDVVHVSFDCSQQDFAGMGSTLSLLCFDIRLKDTYGLFHGTGSLHHLRQEHLTLAKTLTDNIHAIHQWPFNDIDGTRIGLERLLQVGFKIVADSFDKSLNQSVLDRDIRSVNSLIRRSSSTLLSTCLLCLHQTVCKSYQML